MPESIVSGLNTLYLVSSGSRMKAAVILVAGSALAWAAHPGDRLLSRVTVDYPEEGSIFPTEITAPVFLWRDPDPAVRAWLIEVTFTGGSPAIRRRSPGNRLSIGEIDPRCVASTNQPPTLAAQQAAAHTWIPDPGDWSAIKIHSVDGPATITISGFRDRKLRQPVSRGAVTIRTSRDPAVAPIFYRDVPLMPSELEKGVIKPLAAAAIPLIAWRLRDLSQPRSQILLQGMHTCANCHSFSADGKTLGMDLDGTQNDKGLYAISPVQPQMSIRDQDVITWKSFRDQPSGPMRVGFMSAISPDGRYVVTTVGVDQDLSRNYYVANFKDYRFLQVFYATRGVLAVYDRTTGQRHSLPGADDPGYVQTNAPGVPTASIWSLPVPPAKMPTPPAPGPPNSQTTPTRPRFGTTSTACPSTAGAAESPSLSPELRATEGATPFRVSRPMAAGSSSSRRATACSCARIANSTLCRPGAAYPGACAPTPRS
jgi:hypothetical protein